MVGSGSDDVNMIYAKLCTQIHPEEQRQAPTRTKLDVLLAASLQTSQQIGHNAGHSI